MHVSPHCREEPEALPPLLLFCQLYLDLSKQQTKAAHLVAVGGRAQVRIPQTFGSRICFRDVGFRWVLQLGVYYLYLLMHVCKVKFWLYMHFTVCTLANDYIDAR